MTFETIIKRDGRKVSFDRLKITEAIFNAAKSCKIDDRLLSIRLTTDVIFEMVKIAKKELGENDWFKKEFTVEEIQDIVEKTLIRSGHNNIAKAYIVYRSRRTAIRESKIELFDAVKEILKETDKDNANIGNSPSGKMLQIASAASKKYYLTKLIPEEFSKAHIDGRIHIHDLDFYAKTLTCIQIPLRKLLENGFNTGHGFIRPPKRPASATALTAIILQSSQNDMHGGQAFAHFEKDLEPFMSNYKDEDEIYQAMEALVYNLNSMHSRAGAQVPFSSINVGCPENELQAIITKNLLLAYENGLGRGETPLWPNIIFRIKKGINFEKNDPYYWLKQLAIRVSSKRMNPTFSFMDSSFNKQFGSEVAYMGCRTRVIANVNGEEVSTGRGNLSFTSINLPRIALEANGSIDKFYILLNETVDLVIRQLYHRFKIQSKLRVKDMPFLMGQKLYLGSETLNPDDEILPAIINGTLSVGFIGLAEALILLNEKHHAESLTSYQIGENIISLMRIKTDQAIKDYNLNYTLLATPAESTAGRFSKIDKEIFGEIKGVTDKNYYTNSFHVPVDYKIYAYDKVEIEGTFHKYCNAGHISYVEFENSPKHNLEVVETIIDHMYNSDIGYVVIKFPIDFCNNCGFSDLIKDSCPKCGSRNVMSIRRITGYLSTTNQFNDSKISELYDRRKHM